MFFNRGGNDNQWIHCDLNNWSYKVGCQLNYSIVAVQGVIGVSERVDNKLGSTCSHHCAVNGREWSQHSGSVENSQPFPEPNAADLKPSCDPA